MIDDTALEEAYGRGLAAEKAGDRATAGAAYRECLALDPADHVGARIRLASMGLGETPSSAGDAYVATLFDQQADAFEDILVGQLGYAVPETIAERLAARHPARFRQGLDLGCGTGLVGVALAGRCDALIGVDLSEIMVEHAFDKGVYDGLYIGEAVSFLHEFDEVDAFDLIVAADVLPYLGALEPFAEAVAKRLEPGGLLVVSTETLPEAEFDGAAVRVGAHQRFHHRLSALEALFAKHGLETVEAEPITVRMQEGRPAPGHLVIAERSRATKSRMPR